LDSSGTRAFVNTVMKLRVTYKAWLYLSDHYILKDVSAQCYRDFLPNVKDQILTVNSFHMQYRSVVKQLIR